MSIIPSSETRPRPRTLRLAQKPMLTPMSPLPDNPCLYSTCAPAQLAGLWSKPGLMCHCTLFLTLFTFSRGSCPSYPFLHSIPPLSDHSNASLRSYLCKPSIFGFIPDGVFLSLSLTLSAFRSLRLRSADILSPASIPSLTATLWFFDLAFPQPPLLNLLHCFMLRFSYPLSIFTSSP